MRAWVVDTPGPIDTGPLRRVGERQRAHIDAVGHDRLRRPLTIRAHEQHRRRREPVEPGRVDHGYYGTFWSAAPGQPGTLTLENWRSVLGDPATFEVLLTSLAIAIELPGGDVLFFAGSGSSKVRFDSPNYSRRRAHPGACST